MLDIFEKTIQSIQRMFSQCLQTNEKNDKHLILHVTTWNLCFFFIYREVLKIEFKSIWYFWEEEQHLKRSIIQLSFQFKCWGWLTAPRNLMYLNWNRLKKFTKYSGDKSVEQKEYNLLLRLSFVDLQIAWLHIPKRHNTSSKQAKIWWNASRILEQQL